MAKLPALYLKPGEMIFTREPYRITTVLGSCLAVTMYYPPLKIGAICHAVLPSYHQLSANNRRKNAFDFVDTSLEWMMARFSRSGVATRQIEVKMFGGASLFADGGSPDEETGVGRKNIEKALEVMRRERLRLLAWNVGGHHGRKVIFTSSTGEVLSKQLRSRPTPATSRNQNGGRL